MEFEVIIGDRTANIEFVEKIGNYLKIAVDEKIYELDTVTTGNGVYSILSNGKSYDIDVVQGQSNKHFIVNSDMSEYKIEVVDAESRYIKAMNKAKGFDEGNIIYCPMPGKIVKVFVNVGDAVEPGQTLVIVSAMKMESEFKASKAGIVKEIAVKEEDTVSGGQKMIVME
ncbi:MAG: acetyl-CoA carboxylase biotin carboxyl carrier protein subunit [Bacteroidetes bacterium]|nr:acetyl-CoA carboxylase biotin carboxyl carrier protein subunit [Bacteroidota bacterium]